MTLDPVFFTWKVMVPAPAVGADTVHSVSVAVTVIGPPATAPVDPAVDDPVLPPPEVHAPRARRPAAATTVDEVRNTDMRGLPEWCGRARTEGQAPLRVAGAGLGGGVLATFTGRRKRVRTMPT